LGIKNADQLFLLTLQDPADRSNDLGRKSFAWNHIQATFKAAHEMLLKAVNAPEPPKSMLEGLVGGCHEAFSEERRMAEAFGQRILAGGDVSDDSIVHMKSLWGDEEPSHDITESAESPDSYNRSTEASVQDDNEQRKHEEADIDTLRRRVESTEL
jgi:DNA polymerase sigma